MKKRIDLYPTPHVEVRFHLSGEMIRDFIDCKKIADDSDFETYKDCETCSWNELEINGIVACMFEGLEERIKNEQS